MARPPLSLRSPLSILLLLVLRETSAPSHVIAYHLGIDTRTVSNTLSRLKRMGLVDRDWMGFWHLTSRGERYVAMIVECGGGGFRCDAHPQDGCAETVGGR